MSSKREKTQSEQTGNDLQKQIKKLVRGLFYSSESDAPVKLFVGGAVDAVTQENLLSQIGKEQNVPVQTVNFDDFFLQLTTIQDWFGDEEKATAGKFANLRDLLKNNLNNLSVFKIGSIEIDIYVVGSDAENKLMGVKTHSVET